MGWEWINSNTHKFRLGDDCESNEKIHMFNYKKGTDTVSSGQANYSYRNSSTGSFKWQSGDLFNSYDVAVKYVNEGSTPLKISKVGIKACANNSGGKSYYSYSGGGFYLTDPCPGYGGKYYAKVRVFDNLSSWPAHGTLTDLYTNVTPIDESVGGIVSVDNSAVNMKSPGSSSVSATFSFDTAKMTTYEFDRPVVIQPGQIAFIHFGVSEYWNWQSFPDESKGTKIDKTSDTARRVSFQFSLTPSEMEIVIEPADDPAIWQFQSDGKWHLVNSLYKHDGDSWVNMYGG